MPQDLWCVAVQKLHPDAVAPKRATEGSAGYDFCAYLPRGPVRIPAGDFRIIPTGVAVAIGSSSWEMQVRSRSGLGGKEGLVVRQGVATWDSDYRGEVQISMWNTTQHDQVVIHGQRFCQGIFSPVWTGELTVRESLPDTARGSSGRGSTGRT